MAAGRLELLCKACAMRHKADPLGPVVRPPPYSPHAHSTLLAAAVPRLQHTLIAGERANLRIRRCQRFESRWRRRHRRSYVHHVATRLAALCAVRNIKIHVCNERPYNHSSAHF